MELTPELGLPTFRARTLDRARALTRRLPNAVLLGGLVAVITAFNVWWRTAETRPPHWDMGHHLSNSLVYLHGFSISDPLPFLDSYLFYPPLVYWVTDVFYAATGSEAMWVAVLSNAVWLAVLVFSTYAIGKRLWNRRVAWLSVVFVLTAPMIVSSSKDYMLDVPLTAIAALSLYLLMRADGFSSRRYSVLFGAACGCGLLVKWTLPLVLALPVLHAAAGALAEGRNRHRYDRLLNVGAAAAVMFAIAGTWYVHNFAKVAGSLAYYSGPEGVVRGNPPVASLDSALWYFWNLLNVQLYLVPTVLALVGVVFCLRKREFARRNLYPILMAGGTYLLFTLLRHKDPRYSLPMIPPLAIIATSWLEYLTARARTAIATAFVAYAAFAFLAISLGTSLVPKTVAVDIPSAGFTPSEVNVFSQYGYINGAPSHENWHQADAFKAMAALPRTERSFAYRGPDTVWFNAHGLNYFSLRYDAKWLRADRARFLIDRGSAGRAPPAGYVRLHRWPLPDGGTLALFERV